ncbi:ABC transporter ATP-binding protein [Eubacteriaceae bacterium ES3]|nr:ABC transporter ATP-binding protein [Eubacteriaceae bacterium ES3]
MQIKVHTIEKSFKKQKVLQNIDFTIESGHIFCLLGASGSGKTTLLRIIMGALKADSGNVTIGELSVPDRSLLSTIGYMPQNDALYDELTVWENLRFFAGLHKIKRSDFMKAAQSLLEITEMTEFRDKLIRDCSGGMKKRASLMVALLHQPKLLLLDEPTVGVDPVLRRKIWNHLKSLKANGATIVVTTHVMDEVYQCDNAGLIRNGQIVALDTVDNLIASTKNSNIEELFFTTLSESEALS